MNLAWRFGDFVSPKQHRPELGEVSYHWAMGKQQGGYRNRLRRVFSRSLMLLLQKDRLDPLVLQKHLAISPIPCRLLRLPKRIGLKSYLRLSALVVRSFSITSSDASTHFRPA